MPENKKICFNCKHWQIDSDQLPLSRTHYIKKGKVPNAHGKCTATFTDTNGNPQRYDNGMLGGSSCVAEDDRGKELFNPVLP